VLLEMRLFLTCDQAYAILMSASASSSVDPVPVMKHAAKIADEACHITGDTSNDVRTRHPRASALILR
jgi:hypothetical protein